jgi:hypothetical protein
MKNIYIFVTTIPKKFCYVQIAKQCQLVCISFAKLQELSVSRLEKIPGAGFKASIQHYL